MPALWLEEGEGLACVGQEPITCILPEFSSDHPGAEGALLDIVPVPKEAMRWGTDTTLGLVRGGHQPCDSYTPAG